MRWTFISLLLILSNIFQNDGNNAARRRGSEMEGGSLRRIGIGIGFVEGYMSQERKRQLRELTRETFNHAWKSYMRVGFPADEIRPLTCKPLGHDHEKKDNIEINDVLGDFALTLVDSLDTFVVMGDKSEFENAVRLAITHINFNKNVRVQVFEVTIRMLGGLLSGHIFASSPERGFQIKWYRGELLQLARDLANRLLPAFLTPTGIPWARVNLRHGIQSSESTETCSAAAGSLILEFATLSRLTGEPTYEKVAKRAMFAIWNRKSDLDLVGNTIDVQTGNWIYGVSSTGAGIDSLFEYLAKAAILLGEDEYYRAYVDAEMALSKYVKSRDGFWYRGVNMHTGLLHSLTVDSLAAFWPGVQVLMGDLESAIQGHMAYANLWQRYGGIPEVFNIHPKREATASGYPLRPEFVESNYYLYRSTHDSFYMDTAEQIINDIVNTTRVGCGHAVIADLRTKKLEDRMHSFFLSETLKYLFLTFDEENPLNADDSNSVFTTEGHFLVIPPSLLHPPPVKETRSADHQICAMFDPLANTRHLHELSLSVVTRTDAEYARLLTNNRIDEKQAIRSGRWLAEGFCQIPITEETVVELLFANALMPEDNNPGPKKVQPISGSTVGDSNIDSGVLIRNIQGLRFQLTKRVSGEQGWDITRVAQHGIEPGGRVFVSDSSVIEALSSQAKAESKALQHAYLRFSLTGSTHSYDGSEDAGSHGSISFVGQGSQAGFGPSVTPPPGRFRNLFSSSNSAVPSQPFSLNSSPLTLVDLSKVSPSGGCEPYGSLTRFSSGEVVAFVRRGHCSFGRKARLAGEAGAKGIVVSSDEEDLFIPAEDPQERPAEGMMAIPVILIRNSTGVGVEELFHRARTRIGDSVGAVEMGGAGDVTVEVVEEDKNAWLSEPREISLNGYGIRNMVLIPP